MCGILCVLTKHQITLPISKHIINDFINMKHRGPDNTVIKNITNNLLFGFHRLCINDVSNKGDQPFQLNQSD